MFACACGGSAATRGSRRTRRPQRRPSRRRSRPRPPPAGPPGPAPARQALHPPVPARLQVAGPRGPAAQGQAAPPHPPRRPRETPGPRPCRVSVPPPYPLHFCRTGTPSPLPQHTRRRGAGLGPDGREALPGMAGAFAAAAHPVAPRPAAAHWADVHCSAGPRRIRGVIVLLPLTGLASRRSSSPLAQHWNAARIPRRCGGGPCGRPPRRLPVRRRDVRGGPLGDAAQGMGPPAVYAAFVADFDAHMKSTVTPQVSAPPQPVAPAFRVLYEGCCCLNTGRFLLSHFNVLIQGDSIHIYSSRVSMGGQVGR